MSDKNQIPSECKHIILPDEACNKHKEYEGAHVWIYPCILKEPWCDKCKDFVKNNSKT